MCTRLMLSPTKRMHESFTLIAEFGVNLGNNKDNFYTIRTLCSISESFRCPLEDFISRFGTEQYNVNEFCIGLFFKFLTINSYICY